MTLIIGVKCKDGIVVASDSTATLAVPMGGPTVEQQVSKLEIRADRVIFATSGAIGLAQLVLDELDSSWHNILREKRPAQARTTIRNQLVKHIEPRIRMATVYKDVVGPYEALKNATILTMIALPIDDTPVLLQYDGQANCEAATDAIPFIALGSGQDQADPFLAFLKRVLWQDECPSTVGEGIFAALWTAKHVIQVNAGRGIGGEPQLATLTKKDNVGWCAELLPNDRVQEHYQAITGAEEALRDYARNFHP
jgi:20S proteasome alpha/beta subunit